MELWVRTQNRERLIKCENIYIDNIGYTSQKYYISADSIKVTYKLGEYKTKERALEVLDEIHQRLIDLQAMEIDPSCWKTIKRNINCVYKMPEE